jgi:hypothetical protein
MYLKSHDLINGVILRLVFLNSTHVKESCTQTHVIRWGPAPCPNCKECQLHCVNDHISTCCLPNQPKKKIFKGDTQSEDDDLIVSREDLSKTEFEDYLCVMVKNVLKTEIKNSARICKEMVSGTKIVTRSCVWWLASVITSLMRAITCVWWLASVTTSRSHMINLTTFHFFFVTNWHFIRLRPNWTLGISESWGWISDHP